MRDYDTVGMEILKLLGVPSERCRRATIRIEAGGFITVDAEYYSSMEPDPDTGDLETELKRFGLVERNV